MWIALAWAGDLEATGTITLSAPADGVVAAGPDWLVFGPDGAFLVDAAGPSLLATERVAAAGVADLDADGTLDPLLCGRDGLWFTGAAGDLWVADGDCTALSAGSDGWIAILDGVAGTWALDAGVPDGPADPFESAAWTDPIVAAGPSRWLAGELGGTTASEASAAGTSTIAVGGGLSAAVWADRWWLALDEGWVRGVSGSDFPIASPEGIATADVDGDGEAEIIASNAASLVIAGTDGAVRSTLLLASTAFAAGDVDGDGCAEVAALVDSGASLVVIEDPSCGPPVDADGDGFATDVDCDDANPEVHPGAIEACDGVDGDCDGRGDDAGLTLEGPTAVYEGDEFVLAATVGACSLEAPSITVEPGATFSCTADGDARYLCFAADDGEMTAAAAAGEATASIRIVASNLPPEWIGPLTFQPPGAASFDISRMAQDPGDDLVSFEPVGFPADASLTPDGLLQVGESEPTLTVRLLDDQGASTDVTLGFEWPAQDTGFDNPVATRSPDLGCDAGGSSCGGGDLGYDPCAGCGGLGCAMMPSLLVSWLLRRRP